MFTTLKNTVGSAKDWLKAKVQTQVAGTNATLPNVMGNANAIQAQTQPQSQQWYDKMFSGLKTGWNTVENGWSSEVMAIILFNFVKSAGLSGFVIGLDVLVDIEIAAPAVAYAALPFGFVLLTTVGLLKAKHLEHKHAQFADDKWDLLNICTTLAGQPCNREMRRDYHTAQNQGRRLTCRDVLQHPKIRSCIRESDAGVGKGEKALRVISTFLDTVYSTLGLAGATFVYFTYEHALLKSEITNAITISALTTGSVAGFIAGGHSIFSAKREWQALDKHRNDRDGAVRELRRHVTI